MRVPKYQAWGFREKQLFDVIGITWSPDLSVVRCLSLRLDGTIHTATLDECSQYRLREFTGLRDKNRCEIWEGDLVKLDKNNGSFLIAWDVDSAAYWMKYAADEDGMAGVENDRMEVIGNIYEHPELAR
jgi:uncharacterized phage protein (TIGR01671 family)